MKRTLGLLTILTLALPVFAATTVAADEVTGATLEPRFTAPSGETVRGPG